MCLPLPTVGDGGGRMKSILRRKKKTSLCPPRDCLHSLADLGVGWAACLFLGGKCAGRAGRGPGAAGPGRGVRGAQDLRRPAGKDGLGKGGVGLVLGRAPHRDWALCVGVGNNLTYTRGCFWSQAWGLRSRL